MGGDCNKLEENKKKMYALVDKPEGNKSVGRR
jgi:hypothetical protein